MVAFLALVVVVSSRGDAAPEGPPPGFEGVWASLAPEEQQALSEVLDSSPLDPAVIEEELRGVPEGPTPEEIAEAGSEGRFGLRVGLVDSTMSPFRDLIVVENQWAQIADEGTKYREVFAGTSRESESVGIVVVREFPLPQAADAEYPIGEVVTSYTAPGAPFRITDVTGQTLVLSTAAGALVFDLGHRVLDHPPSCSSVAADPSSLWPPDHTMRAVRLSGATDPDGDEVALTVTTVTQDEPLNGLGDGDLSPDAARGSTSSEVLLRAERQGPYDGRVYRVSFTGADGKGGTCTGTVVVEARDSQSKPSVDSGLVFDSFGS